ncbi:MAG: hypothetical protein Q8P67_14840, partial [archaeon]|nr:hypothetical protein [archaeon]
VGDLHNPHLSLASFFPAPLQPLVSPLSAASFVLLVRAGFFKRALAVSTSNPNTNPNSSSSPSSFHQQDGPLSVLPLTSSHSLLTSWRRQGAEELDETLKQQLTKSASKSSSSPSSSSPATISALSLTTSALSSTSTLSTTTTKSALTTSFDIEQGLSTVAP